MFSKLLLKKAGIITLIAFVFLIATAEFSFADEEDALLKARKYYMQGDYDASVKVLQKFIENLRAIVAQKKNVAEAFYLLAKVYYTVGEDSEVDKNLKKVYETFPAFSKDETDLGFKKRIIKIRKEMGLKEVSTIPVKKIEKKDPEKKVILKEGKKKKKFPVLLVVGGVVVVAVLAVLLLKKKKEDEYDIRGRWAIHESIPADPVIFENGIEDDLDFVFRGQLTQGTFTDSYGDVGVYSVTGKSVTIRYTDLNPNVTIQLIGSFGTTRTMSGEIIVKVANYTVNGNWNGRKTGDGANESKRASNTHGPLVQRLLNLK